MFFLHHYILRLCRVFLTLFLLLCKKTCKSSKNFPHTQVKSTISLFFFSYFQLFPLCMPLICHLSPSESHRNLIGTSPNDERIIKQLSPRLQQLFFDIIIQPCRHSRFAILWHTLMFTCLTQCGTMFLCPRFTLRRVT